MRVNTLMSQQNSQESNRASQKLYYTDNNTSPSSVQQ